MSNGGLALADRCVGIFTGRLGGLLLLLGCFECCCCKADILQATGTWGSPLWQRGEVPLPRASSVHCVFLFHLLGQGLWSGERVGFAPFQCKPLLLSILTWKPRKPYCIGMLIGSFLHSLSNQSVGQGAKRHLPIYPQGKWGFHTYPVQSDCKLLT